nr:hypothetical protein [Edaphobacter aggregans]
MNALEGFWNPVSIESVASEAIEMFGLVWTGRRDEFCIERMSFCGEPFQCFAHGHDVVKDQQVSYEMVVLDELTLLIAYAFGGQRAASEGSGLSSSLETIPIRYLTTSVRVKV